MPGAPTPSGILFPPTPKGKSYVSVYKHRGSGSSEHKNVWHAHITPDAEYSIFTASDDGDFYCSEGHYWGIVDKGKTKLGENGERVCKFPKTKNLNDPWHGYPVETRDHVIEEDLIALWEREQIITRSIARRIRRRLL